MKGESERALKKQVSIVGRWIGGCGCNTLSGKWVNVVVMT